MQQLFKALILSFILIGFNVKAADDLMTFDFNTVVERGYAEGILDKNIHFILKGNTNPAIDKNFGEFATNKKTNGFGKSDKKSCDWALLSALKQLQERAQSLDADYVINIISNYKSKEYEDSEQYQCGVGFLMSGVALKADIVRSK
jgi:hypothetical protein